MKRLFFIRKDLNLSPSKLASIVGHAVELWWINLFKINMTPNSLCSNSDGSNGDYKVLIDLKRILVDDYIYGVHEKIILGVDNLTQLNIIDDRCWSHGLFEDRGYGYINDCLTELKLENPDRTTIVGIWTYPLDDRIVREISKGFKLYE